METQELQQGARVNQVEDEKSKTVTIIVDGTPHGWPKSADINYVQVVTLEVPDYAQHPEITYSVTYKKGPADDREGILAPGGAPVKVKDGMVFHVSPTSQS